MIDRRVFLCGTVVVLTAVASGGLATGAATTERLSGKVHAFDGATQVASVDYTEGRAVTIHADRLTRIDSAVVEIGGKETRLWHFHSAVHLHPGDTLTLDFGGGTLQ